MNGKRVNLWRADWPRATQTHHADIWNAPQEQKICRGIPCYAVLCTQLYHTVLYHTILYYDLDVLRDVCLFKPSGTLKYSKILQNAAQDLPQPPLDINITPKYTPKIQIWWLFGLKGAPRSPFGSSRGAQEAPRVPQGLPKVPKRGSKGAKN